MNPELPKPMLDALARETGPVDHPSADALAAFVERTLASEENRQVTEHLARCGDCRETVFLASGAAEESEVDHRELVAAAAAQITLQPATEAGGPRARRLVWAMPLAAAFLIAAGVLVWQQAQRPRQGLELASKAESKVEERRAVPAPTITPQQPSTEGMMQSTVRKPAPKASPAKSVASKTPSVVGERARPSAYDAMGVEEPVESGAPVAKDEADKIAIGGPITAAPAGQAGTRAFAIAPSKREGVANTHSASSVAVLNRMAVNPRVAGPSPEWRVTQEGHLERLTANGWSRVLVDETAMFRVVAVIGNEVWAGGAGGALFHSNNGGQEWKAVSLGGADVGTISSIRFDDGSHGMVVTDAGKRWSTSDGGATWMSQ
jgi:Photosynthesis system II assembly factor YCF48/Putative zinc-finger